ncbi:MAG: TRAM domain-containing protein [Thermaerobacter sp.]|nr:TRAM domain-containing protein [Thermaerobacter sp.]
MNAISTMVRRALAFAGVLTGLTVALHFQSMLPQSLTARLGPYGWIAIVAAGMLAGGLIGSLLAPWAIARIVELSAWLENRAQRTPLQDLLSGGLGAALGLFLAFLLTPALASVPILGSFLPAIVAVVAGYVGLVVGLKKREEIFGGNGVWSRLGQRERPGRTAESVAPKVLDTSVIIDGRIADICQAGFLEGTLIVPSFVLEELRHIADSSDSLKRNRGRRGLDVLNRMRSELGIKVQVHERDAASGLEVDDRLLRLCKVVGGKIVTNDYNLNKVAELQGIMVLNINELANAVKPVVLPGEEMSVHVIKNGKETGQGVAYLDDGTMIVVDGGRRYIGETVEVLVTSVLQTAAGRMIFARPRDAAEPDRIRAQG